MKKTEKIIAAILTMAVGILLIAMQDKFIGLLMSIAGTCLIVLGVVDLFHRYVPPAVIKMVAGALIIICGWVLVEAVLYIVSAMLLIAGILLLYDKIKKRVRCDTMFKTVLEYALPSVFIVIGGVLLFHQAFAMEIIFVITGILTLFDGGILLLEAFEEE
jgi:hypothetical protein